MYNEKEHARNKKERKWICYYTNSKNVDGFEPLDDYEYMYGCTEIQYMDENGKYETL